VYKFMARLGTGRSLGVLVGGRPGIRQIIKCATEAGTNHAQPLHIHHCKSEVPVLVAPCSTAPRSLASAAQPALSAPSHRAACFSK